MSININDITREEAEKWMEDRRQGLGVDMLTLRAGGNSDELSPWSAYIGKKLVWADNYIELMSKIRECDPEKERQKEIAELKAKLTKLEGVAS